MNESLEWFKQLPLYYENDYIRVVHACWEPEKIKVLEHQLGGNLLKQEFLEASATEGTDLYEAVDIVLAFVGINLLRSQSASSHRQNRDKHQDDTQGQVIDGELISDDSSAAEADATQSNTHSDDTKIDVFTVLGGGNFSTRSKRLTNGNIIAILGGAEVDIREADSLKNALEIDIVAFMGGVEIKVPPHFNVTVKLLPLLGGVTNKTTCLADKMGVPAKHLVLTGMALMGGVEITN